MKKRGLIVATIVMVLVLAVSLTTATYAWFSSQASATVDDLAITTKAADGLQIAMTNTKKSIADLQSGELLYENSKWIGETSTWGSYLGFANIEQDEWPDAVTNNSAGNAINYNTGTFKATADETAQTGKKYYLATSHTNLAAFATGVVYYELSGGTYSKTADETANSGKTYYTLSIGAFDKTKSLEEIVAQTSAAGFLKPTGYDSSITPTGFDTAKVNVDYFEFDMAITNVTDIYKLGMGIIVTATETSAGVIRCFEPELVCDMIKEAAIHPRFRRIFPEAGTKRNPADAQKLLFQQCPAQQIIADQKILQIQNIAVAAQRLKFLPAIEPQNARQRQYHQEYAKNRT